MLISEHPTAEMSIALSDLSRQRSWVEMQRHIEQLSRFLAEVAELQPGDGIALLTITKTRGIEITQFHSQLLHDIRIKAPEDLCGSGHIQAHEQHRRFLSSR